MEIFSLGAPEYLAAVLNAVSMTVNDPVYGSLARAFFVIGVLCSCSLYASGQTGGLAPKSLIAGLIAYLCLFGPSVTVTVSDAWSGKTSRVAHVPMAVAAFGSVVSGAGFAMAETMEQYFSVPSSTASGGFLGTLETLASVRDLVAGRQSMGELNDRGSADLRRDASDYIRDCSLVGVRLGLKSLDEMLLASDPVEAIRFDSSVYGTSLSSGKGADGKRTELNCTEAHKILAGRLTGEFYPAIRSVLSQNSGRARDGVTSGTAELGDALSYLAGNTASRQDFVLAAALLPAYRDAAAKRLEGEQSFAAAVAVREAAVRANADMALKGSVFGSYIRPLMAFAEGFAYAICPFIGLLLLTGSFGFAVLGHYLRLLCWICLWWPTSSVVNLFVMMAASGKISSSLSMTGAPLTSFSGLGQFDLVLDSCLGMAGLFAASIPALSGVLVFGASKAASALGGAFALSASDASLTPPSVSIGAAVDSKSAFETSRISGTVASGAAPILGALDLRSAAASGVSAIDAKAAQSAESFSQSVSGAVMESASTIKSYASMERIGRSVMASDSESSAYARQIADQIAERHGISHDRKIALTGMVSTALSAGMGGQAGIGSLFKGFLGGSGTLGESYGESLASQSAFGSSAADAAVASELEAVGSSRSMTAAYSRSLASDLSNGKSTALSETVGSSRTRALTEMAAVTVSESKQLASASSALRGLAWGAKIDCAALATRIAANPEAMASLYRFASSHPNVGAAVRASLPMYSEMLPDRKTAYAASLVNAAVKQAPHDGAEALGAVAEAWAAASGGAMPADASGIGETFSSARAGIMSANAGRHHIGGPSMGAVDQILPSAPGIPANSGSVRTQFYTAAAGAASASDSWKSDLGEAKEAIMQESSVAVNLPNAHADVASVAGIGGVSQSELDAIASGSDASAVRKRYEAAGSAMGLTPAQSKMYGYGAVSALGGNASESSEEYESLRRDIRKEFGAMNGARNLSPSQMKTADAVAESVFKAPRAGNLSKAALAGVRKINENSLSDNISLHGDK